MIAQDEEEETLIISVRGPGSQPVYIQDVSSFDCHYYRFCHNNYDTSFL